MTGPDPVSLVSVDMPGAGSPTTPGVEYAGSSISLMPPTSVPKSTKVTLARVITVPPTVPTMSATTAACTRTLAIPHPDLGASASGSLKLRSRTVGSHLVEHATDSLGSLLHPLGVYSQRYSEISFPAPAEC